MNDVSNLVYFRAFVQQQNAGLPVRADVRRSRIRLLMKLAQLISVTLLLTAFVTPGQSFATVLDARQPSRSQRLSVESAIRNHEMAARAPRGFGSFETELSRCLSKRPGIYQRLCEEVLGSNYDLMLPTARMQISQDPRLKSQFSRD